MQQHTVTTFEMAIIEGQGSAHAYGWGFHALIQPCTPEEQRRSGRRIKVTDMLTKRYTNHNHYLDAQKTVLRMAKDQDVEIFWSAQ